MGKFLWLADSLASTADCGHYGENQNAGWSCVLLSEEGGKRWQIVYMSQVPLDDGPRSTGSGTGLLVFGVGGG